MRRNRNHYSAVLGAELLLISALVLVVSGPALAQTAAGSFSSVSGQVQIQRTGATIGAASGVGVDVGDRIVTGASGHAVIVLNDQSRLELGPVSSITLDEFTITGGTTSTRVGLVSGVLRSLVNASSGGAPANYQVHTPNAVAAVRGTRFDTAYSENVIRPGYKGCDRYTDVSVYQGTVNLASLAAPNAGQNIGAGYEATVPCNQSPTTAGPLSMTGAVSLDSANAGSGVLGFTGTSPGSSGAPAPACPPMAPWSHSPPPPPPYGGIVGPGLGAR
ncbi:MAG: FecR family protein [Candidatus Binatus sp.]|uniref:FecR family protein n=1 Tax=Candidatus Binatus sp. TaxID=2811406 RepID=UPI003C76D864